MFVNANIKTTKAKKTYASSEQMMLCICDNVVCIFCGQTFVFYKMKTSNKSHGEMNEDRV